MFKNLFNKSVELTPITKEVIVPCTCNGNNEHCDSILWLRKYQDLRKELKNEIEMLNKDSRELLCYIVSFLKKLGENKFNINSSSSWIDSDYNMHILEATINQYSSGDIFRMTEELKTYRNKADIICDKQRALKVLENDIEEIKSKLGIE